jgi:hypothetical protein
MSKKTGACSSIQQNVQSSPSSASDNDCLVPSGESIFDPAVYLTPDAILMYLVDEDAVVDFVKSLGEIHDEHVRLKPSWRFLMRSSINSISCVSQDLFLRKTPERPACAQSSRTGQPFS